MKIPLLNIQIIKRSRFDQAIAEAAEQGRAEQRQLTNALIAKLLRENARLRVK
jgi:hypothetical protein